MKKTLLLLGLCLLSTTSFAKIETVSVIAAGNSEFNSSYSKSASQLASSLAGKKKKVFCSGIGTGLSGAFLKTIENKKADFTAVTYQEKNEKNCPKNHACQQIEMQKVSGIEEQTEFFFQQGDGIVLLPGGFEVMYAFNYLETLIKNKNISMKPVVFLNTNHFWDRMNEMLIEMRRQNIISKDVLSTIAFESKPDNVVATLEKLQRNIESIQKKEQ